jgi:hypothetical protein
MGDGEVGGKPPSLSEALLSQGRCKTVVFSQITQTDVRIAMDLPQGETLCNQIGYHFWNQSHSGLKTQFRFIVSENVYYPGSFAGNLKVSFTSSVQIAQTGGVWRTVGGTLQSGIGIAVDNDGAFTLGETIRVKFNTLKSNLVFSGVSSSFGGGFIAQDTSTGGFYYLYDYNNAGGVPTNTGGESVVFQAANLKTLCFVAGTKIRTPEGEKSIEQLQAGDLISTANGAKSLKFLCKTTRSFKGLLAVGKNPIRVAAGTFGATADLLMSPSHALSLEGCLIEAGALINHASVDRVTEWNAPELTYFNLELDQHEQIWANGVGTESYFSNYRTNGFSREDWDNYSEYVALYGEGELMQELDMPRIAFSRQIPAAVAAKLELNTEAKELALV